MYFPNRIITLVPVIAIVQPIAVMALDAPQIYQIAENISVLIDGQNPGSGVIIAQQDNTYYVLTAKHVVATEDEYEIVTSDGQRYILDYSKVTKINNVDLAVVQFTSDQQYNIAQLADSNQALPGMEVHIYGFPNPGREITQRIPQFTSGQITAKSDLNEGYGLIYTNVTRAGMSGGPVLNSNGQVVGIHGRAEAESNAQETINQAGNSFNGKIGFNLGIPIATFVEKADELGIDLESNNQLSNSNPSNQISVPVTPNPATGIPSRPTVITAPQDNNENNPVCAGRTC